MVAWCWCWWGGEDGHSQCELSNPLFLPDGLDFSHVKTSELNEKEHKGFVLTKKSHRTLGENTNVSVQQSRPEEIAVCSIRGRFHLTRAHDPKSALQAT